ncbi:serine/threonine-protein kinase Nek5-like [Mytilus californianus]|uniref:serine/threonine-protein kinase Nek5-like n=1 Tax=Mytilus californianus TaxID=6549 RepID=UPI002247B308|nr:serine/threonine-protein kinase Nek5-like [Mytilus californianus]
MAAAAGPIEFELEKTLGEGAFGKVFLCCDKTDKSQKYAMKVIDLSKSPQEEREAAEREARLLSDFKHENIIAYIDSFQEKGALCIVTEFCDGGDLSEFIEKRGGRPFNEDQIVNWFRQICSGLQYLHGRNCLHRDIKTQNVFLTGPKKIAKLGDLGLAKVLERPNAKAVTFCGSPYYMSPEIFACKPYDTKSDIWAMGVVIYEMSTLERPFDAMLMQQLVFKIVHGELPPMPKDKYSAQFCSLLEKMMCKDSKTRPSADDVLSDSLFTTFKKPKTPPAVLPQKSQFASTMSKAGFESIIMQGTAKKKDAFDMKELVGTLNDKQQKYARSVWAASTKGVENIMEETITENKKNYDKDKTLKSLSFMQKKKPANTDDIGVDFEDTLKQDEALRPIDPRHMVNLVVHTLTQIFPKGEDGEVDTNPIALNAADTSKMTPEELLLHQIAMLQAHCCKVLGFPMFRRAYDLLDATDDNMELEEKLIKLLTPEKFAMTGVQLFYCKNFEYNLDKLKSGSGQTDA